MSVSINEQGQFWVDVAAAHDRVAVNHASEVVVERDGKAAVIFYSTDGFICIEITEAFTETREPLPVPGGS
jgi:hypothetical protein